LQTKPLHEYISQIRGGYAIQVPLYALIAAMRAENTGHADTVQFLPKQLSSSVL